MNALELFSNPGQSGLYKSAIACFPVCFICSMNQTSKTVSTFKLYGCATTYIVAIARTDGNSCFRIGNFASLIRERILKHEVSVAHSQMKSNRKTHWVLMDCFDSNFKIGGVSLIYW